MTYINKTLDWTACLICLACFMITQESRADHSTLSIGGSSIYKRLNSKNPAIFGRYTARIEQLYKHHPEQLMQELNKKTLIKAITKKNWIILQWIGKELARPPSSNPQIIALRRQLRRDLISILEDKRFKWLHQPNEGNAHLFYGVFAFIGGGTWGSMVMTIGIGSTIGVLSTVLGPLGIVMLGSGVVWFWSGAHQSLYFKYQEDLKEVLQDKSINS